jgi:hypothetical protein
LLPPRRINPEGIVYFDWHGTRLSRSTRPFRRILRKRDVEFDERFLWD